MFTLTNATVTVDLTFEPEDRITIAARDGAYDVDHVTARFMPGDPTARHPDDRLPYTDVTIHAWRLTAAGSRDQRQRTPDHIGLFDPDTESAALVALAHWLETTGGYAQADILEVRARAARALARKGQ